MSTFFQKRYQPQRGEHDPANVSNPSHTQEPAASRSQPLDGSTGAFMEQRFGHDFSKVRVYTDERAAHSAGILNARAYTLGNNIVFGKGDYSPGTREGKTLIAHELTHVIQQGNSQSRVQAKMRLGNPADEPERVADRVAGTVISTDEAGKHSTALQIREQLRHSSVSSPVIQRAVKTWGGEFDTDKYDITADPGMDGVDIEIKFKPNKHADAEMIGMTQTARSLEKGVPIPTAIFGAAGEKALKERTIPAADPGAGTRVDQLSTHGNPLYATDKPGAKDALSATPTVAVWGEHGWHYTDKGGKLQAKDALLKDTPQLPSALKESSQTFETTALAVKGAQEGTFYGSVQWGWQKSAAGKVTKLPLSLISNDVPSATFASATKLWNKAKTSEGKDTLDLPIVTGKYTKTPGVWLVSDPNRYKSTVIDKLAKNTRLEVTNEGTAEPFNKTADKGKWWKVTIVDGTQIGKVGWVMQLNLSDIKT